MMDRRFGEESFRQGKGSITLQKNLVESRRPNKPADLTDFMNDMFFGTANADTKRTYNLSGGRFDEDDEESFDDSTRNNSSRLTQEWLEEARRMVASSPSRGDSPTRLIGSPRFAGAVPGKLSTSPALDRRDPLSRSARRFRSVEGFSGEILTKSAKHNRNKSESLDTNNTLKSPSETSPASQVQRWFSNILKPPNPTSSLDPTSPHQSNDLPPGPIFDPTFSTLPPRQSINRRSRFQSDASAAPVSQGIPVPPRRSFKAAPLQDSDHQVLSPPNNLVESAKRRSISSSTCSQLHNKPLSPPRNLVESAHRRSISRSTCCIEKIAPRPNANEWPKEAEEGDIDTNRELSLNSFLKEQRIKIEKILNQEFDSKAKVILSGPSYSTSSMVSAICYAWLLENRVKKNKGEGDREEYVVVPVMNVRREKMWKQRQAAWLFHHVGLDTTSLLFADEVDLESLMMEGQLNMLVVGQDILRNSGEVGSQCTVLTDNYCEDAYDLLQIPLLKKLLLAGILLDTQNVNASSKSSMTRDAEAVQLLLVGLPPNYRNALFDQLMQDQRDNSFFEALRHSYGKPPSESGYESRTQMENRGTDRKSTSGLHREAITQNSEKKAHDIKNGKSDKDALKSAKTNTSAAPKAAPGQPAPDESRGKNRFFLAKWFGFGSK